MYKKAILFYVSLSGLSVIFSGCCPDPYTVTAEFKAYFGDISDVSTTSMIDTDTDTIRDAFGYFMDAVVIASHENSMLNDFNIFHSAYALSCTEEYLNPYTFENASLTLDKPFLLDGHVIAAGTNLFDLAISVFSETELNAYVFETSFGVVFRREVIQRLRFPLDTYTFVASVNMEDGTIVSSADAVVIEIN